MSCRSLHCRLHFKSISAQNLVKHNEPKSDTFPRTDSASRPRAAPILKTPHKRFSDVFFDVFLNFFLKQSPVLPPRGKKEGEGSK